MVQLSATATMQTQLHELFFRHTPPKPPIPIKTSTLAIVGEIEFRPASLAPCLQERKTAGPRAPNPVS